MKALQALAAMMLIGFSYSIQADPPDPTPGATKPVKEQNLDENGWIAVHEQGVADVKVTEGQIDANITGGSVDANIVGGSVEAEISGGELEVTNEVTVKLAEDAVIGVDIVNDRRFAHPIIFNMDKTYTGTWHVYTIEDYDLSVQSMVCEVTSDIYGIEDELVVYVYTVYELHSEFSRLRDVCTSFSKGISNGSITPTFSYFCKSDSHWTTRGGNSRWIFTKFGAPDVPLNEVTCTLNAYRYR